MWSYSHKDLHKNVLKWGYNPTTYWMHFWMPPTQSDNQVPPSGSKPNIRVILRVGDIPHRSSPEWEKSHPRNMDRWMYSSACKFRRGEPVSQCLFFKWKKSHQWSIKRGFWEWKIPTVEWETSSERNPTAEDFDSCWTIKKEPVVMYVLMSQSQGNSISEMYRHFSVWGKFQQWRNLIAASKWGISHLRAYGWMYVVK